MDIDFLVIGAQKCATTWLYECLLEHPDLCVPKSKREKEYIGSSIVEEKGIDWYKSLVSHAKPGQVKGHISVEYFFDERSPKLVKKYLPGVKLIVILRNPAERAISAYYWYLRKGYVSNNKNILETFTDIKDGLLKGDFDISNADIIARGKYDVQLQRYLNEFSPEQIKILSYSQIDKSPQKVLNELCDFLNVQHFIPESLNIKPKQNSKSPLLIKFERLVPKSRIISWLANKFNQLLSKHSSKKEYNQLEKEVYSLCMNLFDTSIKNLQKILTQFKDIDKLQGEIISDWKKKQ